MNGWNSAASKCGPASVVSSVVPVVHADRLALAEDVAVADGPQLLGVSVERVGHRARPELLDQHDAQHGPPASAASASMHATTVTGATANGAFRK